MVEIRWNPTAKDLRGFGFVILIGFGLIGLSKAFWPFAWGFTPHLHAGLGTLAGAILIGVPAILGWRIVLPAYWAWMGLAWAGSKIMFPLLFSAFYYLAFFPIGVAMRLSGHDPLQIRRRGEGTYWVPLEQEGEPAGYERQY
ncbi:MAG: hypothetical protein WC003_00790 [Terrimicrobiaceae bacterium]